MYENDVFERMNEIATTPQFSLIFGEDSEHARKIAEHKDSKVFGMRGPVLKSLTRLPFISAISIRQNTTTISLTTKSNLPIPLRYVPNGH